MARIKMDDLLSSARTLTEETEELARDLESQSEEEVRERAFESISQEFLAAYHICEVLRYTDEEVIREIELWDNDAVAVNKIVEFFLSTGYNVEVNRCWNKVAVRITKN